LGDDDIRISPKALAALIVFAIGGNGAVTYFSTRPESVRPDPFTGAMAEQLEERLNARIMSNQRQLDILIRDLKDVERRLINCERDH